MYYLCSENKGADQLCGYREADLFLCFRICKKRSSHDAAPMMMNGSNLKLPGIVFVGSEKVLVLKECIRLAELWHQSIPEEVSF